MTTWNDEQAAAIEALFNSGVTPEQFVALYARVIEERPEVGNAHVKDVIGKDRTGVRIGGERGERSTHFESKYPGSTVSCVAAIIRQGENGPEMLAGKRSDSRLTLPGGHLLAPVPSELRELEAGSDKSMKEIIRDSLETPAASTHEEDARRLHVTLDQAMTDELIQETGMAFVPKSLDEAGKSKFIENAKESFGEEIIIVQDYDIVAKTAFGEPHDYREGDKRFLTEIGFAIHVHDPAVQRLPQELAGSDDLEEGGLRWMPQHEITRELLDSARNFTHGKTPAVEAAWQKLFDSMEIAVRLDNQDILYIKPAAMEQAIEEVAGRFGLKPGEITGQKGDQDFIGQEAATWLGNAKSFMKLRHELVVAPGQEQAGDAYSREQALLIQYAQSLPQTPLHEKIENSAISTTREQYDAYREIQQSREFGHVRAIENNADRGIGRNL